MPVKIITKEAKLLAEKQKKVSQTEIVDIVEEMAELVPQVDALKKYKARYEALRVQLCEKIPEGMEAEGIEFFGEKHKVEFSPCQMERTIADLVKLRNTLGEQTFMDIVKIALGDVDKYLSEVEQESIIVKTQTGPRKCTVKELP